jgi:acyl carrier protein
MSTFERLNGVLDELVGVKAENEDQKFREDLNLDSLDWIELTLMLEDEFGIEIPEEVYDKGQITTVRQAVEYLDKRLAE